MGSDGFDSGGRYALIIAAGRYEDSALGRLRSPAKDAEELTDVLEDPAIGGYEVRQLVDQPDYVVRVQLEGFFADAHPDDLLLLYLSCHGVKDQSGRLHFATVNTRPNRLASTGISAEFVYQQVERCRSRKVVLLLDCCYSGAYARGHRPRAPDDASLGSLGDRGWAVITSSTALEYAFEIDAGKVSWTKALRKAVPSFFTSAVVEGLRTGAADLNRDGLVSFDELYDYVWASVRQRTPHQTPVKKWGDVRGDIVIARNPHPCAPEPPQPPSQPAGPGRQISRRRVVAGMAAAAAATGVSYAGWTFWQTGPGSQIWKFTTSNAVAAGPVVTSGVVYADSGDDLYALRAADGRRIWSRFMGANAHGSLLVTNGIVFSYDSSGTLLALRAADGAFLWPFSFASMSAFTGAPALTLADGSVYVGDYQGDAYALHVQGGGQAWRVHAGAGSLAWSPAVVDGTVYVCTTHGAVRALRASDGGTVWNATAGTDAILSFGVAAGVVLAVSLSGYVYALHARSGRHLWTRFIGFISDPGEMGLVIADGVAYFQGAGYVYALRVRDGRRLWQSSIGAQRGSVPLVTRGTVYVGSGDHNLYAFRASDGRRKWRFRTGGEVTSPPVAAGGLLYFGSYDHRVYAVRSDGSRAWSFATAGPVTTSPAVLNAVVYAGSADGNVYALRT